jgi:hypothetical protein
VGERVSGWPSKGWKRLRGGAPDEPEHTVVLPVGATHVRTLGPLVSIAYTSRRFGRSAVWEHEFHQAEAPTWLGTVGGTGGELVELPDPTEHGPLVCLGWVTELVYTGPGGASVVCAVSPHMVCSDQRVLTSTSPVYMVAPYGLPSLLCIWGAAIITPHGIER